MTKLTARLSDRLLAIGLAALAEADVWLNTAPGHRLVAGGGALLATLPLVWRRRAPFEVAGGLAGVTIALSLTSDPPDGPWTAIALLVATFTAAAECAASMAAAAAALALAAFVAAIVAGPQDVRPADVVYVTVLVGAVWQAGRVIRRRRLHAEGLEQHAARLERDREEQARAAVADERARIARELHDVVAHSVSVAVVQAEAGETLLERDPDAARQAFVAIQDTGRQALAELSRLLGIMRKDGDAPNLAPPASISRLASLVEEMRAAGLPVDIVVVGRPRQLAPGVDLSAYRIVQEALTNTLKHAGPAHAVVRVAYGQRALEVEVTDDGAGTANGADRAGGHGLVGMRERVTLYGGELEAGRRPEGGYAVRARLPLEPAERR